MTVTINGAAIPSREALHDALCAQLPLPAWYGRNLDALYDCLTDLPTEVEVVLQNREALSEALGAYAAAFCAVLRDAARENPRLRWADEKEDGA